MTSFTFEGHPGRILHLLLFEDVTNSSELLQQLQDGSLEPELGFMNAALVVNLFPLLAAAHKALLSQSRNSLRTRTLHSELVFNYSASKHISESLRKWGISADTSYILVSRFDATVEELEKMRILVKGKEVNILELKLRANTDLIQKNYKIGALELESSSLEDAIVSRIASRESL